MATTRSKALTFAVLLLGAVIATDALSQRSRGHPPGARTGNPSHGHAGGHPGSRPPSGGHYGHGGHGGYFVPWFGAGFAYAPFYDPFYFYPLPAYYYYYSEPLMAPTEPVYVEQYPGQSAPQQSGYWYYCASSKAYYPYVRECPEGWQQVPPQPPN